MATKQGAFESVFGTFSVTKKWRFWTVISLDMNEPDLSVPSEDEEEEVFPTMCWEHATDILFNLSPLHPDG